MFLKFKPFVGPLDIEFVDPDTGYRYTAPDMASLISRIQSYRSQNKLKPIDFLPQVVENYLCNLPQHSGCCEPAVSLNRTVGQYIRGGIALARSFLYRHIASQELADERAEQCVSCPHNFFPKKTSLEHATDQLITMQVGSNRSKYDKHLGHCKVCSCPLRAKVFYDSPIDLSDEEAAAMEKVSCWQLKSRSLTPKKETEVA